MESAENRTSKKVSLSWHFWQFEASSSLVSKLDKCSFSHFLFFCFPKLLQCCGLKRFSELFHIARSLGFCTSRLSLWSYRTASLDVEPVYTFRAHSGPVLCLAVDATGEHCYSGGYDASIRCWSIPNSNIDPYDSFGEFIPSFQLFKTELNAVQVVGKGYKWMKRKKEYIACITFKSVCFCRSKCSVRHPRRPYWRCVGSVYARQQNAALVLLCRRHRQTVESRHKVASFEHIQGRRRSV